MCQPTNESTRLESLLPPSRGSRKPRPPNHSVFRWEYINVSWSAGQILRFLKQLATNDLHVPTHQPRSLYWNQTRKSHHIAPSSAGRHFDCASATKPSSNATHCSSSRLRRTCSPSAGNPSYRCPHDLDLLLRSHCRIWRCSKCSAVVTNNINRETESGTARARNQLAMSRRGR